MSKRTSRAPKERSTEATLYAPYAKDLRLFLTSFLERQTTLFAEFKEEWKAQKFSLIHSGKPDDVSGKVFIQELFTTCVGYLLLNYPFEVRVAVLYLLYCIYETQPHKPKVKIFVSIDVFNELLRLRQEVKAQQVVDAYHILNKLRAENAFCHCAVVKIDAMLSSLLPPQQQSLPIPDELHEADTLSQVLRQSQMNNLAQQYHSVKQHYAITNNLQFQQSTNVVNSLQIAKPVFISELHHTIEQHKENKPVREQTFSTEVAMARSGRLARAVPQSATVTNRTRRRRIQRTSIVESMKQLFPTLAQAAESDESSDEEPQQPPQQQSQQPQQQQQASTSDSIPPQRSETSLTDFIIAPTAIKEEPPAEKEKSIPERAKAKEVQRKNAVQNVNMIVDAFLRGTPSAYVVSANMDISSDSADDATEKKPKERKVPSKQREKKPPKEKKPREKKSKEKPSTKTPATPSAAPIDVPATTESTLTETPEATPKKKRTPKKKNSDEPKKPKEPKEPKKKKPKKNTETSTTPASTSAEQPQETSTPTPTETPKKKKTSKKKKDAPSDSAELEEPNAKRARTSRNAKKKKTEEQELAEEMDASD